MPAEPRKGSRKAHLPFAASYSLEHGELAGAVFVAHVIERGLPYTAGAGWTTRLKTVELEATRLFLGTNAWSRTEILEMDDALVSVTLQAGHANVVVAAPTEKRIVELHDRLRSALPAPDPSGRQEVDVTFWTYGPHGPMASWRTIAVPEWAEIRANYTASVRDELERLMTDFTPAHGGQLVLWHGESGTGKTFALRALAWEWRDWCDVHYVVDPDSFFGQHADYLMHVLLQPGAESGWTGYGPSVVSATADEPSEAGEETRKKDWRLLVLEDTGELLQPDAKAVIGQGLARFLNLVDGLIGQGLRVLVLVTTNEEIKKLHPAVARPGRCAADIAFARLSEPESAAWLEAHGSTVTPERGRTVAELYGMLEGGAEPKPSESFDDEPQTAT